MTIRLATEATNSSPLCVTSNHRKENTLIDVVAVVKEVEDAIDVPTKKRAKLGAAAFSFVIPPWYRLR
jgi:hypothetical protein